MLKTRWSTPTETYFAPLRFVNGDRMVLGFSGEGGAGFDRGNGRMIDRFKNAGKRIVYNVFHLPDNRFGIWAPGAFKQVVDLFDEGTGAGRGVLAVPDVSPPVGDAGYPVVRVSRNARYAASGWSRPSVKEKSDLALRVFDLERNKTILSRDWTGGSCHFTADSSRVLVAENNGRCRWYKLPSGEAEGGWDLGFPTVGFHDVMGASDDGSILTYIGPFGRKEGQDGLVVATLDGKTGALVCRLGINSNPKFRTTYPVVITSDGRRVLVNRLNPAARSHIYDVMNARTGAIDGRISPGLVHNTATLSHDGTALALALRDPKPTVQLFDVPAAASNPTLATGLKVRWSAENKEEYNGKITLDADGEKIAVSKPGATLEVAVFSARTGAAAGELRGVPGAYSRPLPLQGGRFAFHNTGANQMMVWDPRGLRTDYPFPAPGGTGTPSVNISPNGGYMMIAAPQYRPVTEKQFAASTLRVREAGTEKDLVKTEWHVGTTAFTADSSRILLVEETGRFRWFKLPSGTPDGEWSFKLKPNGFNARDVTISADGGLILYHGPVPGKELTHHLLDGKKGIVLHSFPKDRYLSYAGSVSDDGRHVMLVRTDGLGTGHTVEILDLRGNLVTSARMADVLDNGFAGVQICWKTGTLVAPERANAKVTVYDLPDLGAGTVPAPDAGAVELIRNGNFEQGNKEFRTGYRHTPGTVLDALTYDVVTDPNRSHQDAASFGDHTSGKGHMLVVNGGKAPDQEVWAQTVEVKPGVEYTLSLWVATWYALSPAELDVHINGKSVGKVTAPDKCGTWKQLKVKWKAGTARTARIEIFDRNTSVAGNDFALDDISLQGPGAAPPKKP
jgi:hypothetical protein